MPACVFMQCKNHSRDKNKKHGITFHIFPHCARCKTKWIAIIRKQRREPEWAPTSSSRVCSNHFKESDMYLTPNGLHKIRKGAAPSLEESSDDLLINPECTSTYDSLSNTCCSSPRRKNSEEKLLENSACCWQPEHYFLFISLYREQECLWNPQSAEYRESGARTAALSCIADGMGLSDFTITDVEKKIKYIRSVYVRELNRIEESLRLGAGTIYNPVVEWFNALDSFLRNQHAGTSTTQGLLQTEVKVEFACDDDEDVDQNFVPLHPDSVSWGAADERPAKRLRGEGREGGDEFWVFARHVATQLRALPLARALEAQETIQSTLTRYRLKTLRE